MTVKEVGWVRRSDAEVMEKKAEDTPKMKKTRIDNEREEGHTRKRGKVNDISRLKQHV